MSYGVIIRAPSLQDQLIAQNQADLSFSDIEQGVAVVSFGDKSIASHFIDTYGSAPLAFQPEIQTVTFFEGMARLRWSEDISNPLRAAFLKEQGIDSIGDVCMYADTILDGLETSNAVDDPPAQIFMMDAIADVQNFDPVGDIMIETVMSPENDVLVCSFDDGNAGTFYSGYNVLNLNRSASADYGVDFLDRTEAMFADAYKLRLNVAFEEVAHAHIALTNPDNRIGFDAPYPAEDVVLYNLAEEASVKLQKAIVAVQNVYELGDNFLYNSMIERGDGEADMASFLLEKVREGDGLAALSNTENLAQAWELFFQNTVSMEQYFESYMMQMVEASPYMKEDVAPMPISVLENGHGILIATDDDTNFLQGRFDALSDIVDLMPEESAMKALLQTSSSQAEPKSSVDCDQVERLSVYELYCE